MCKPPRENEDMVTGTVPLTEEETIQILEELITNFETEGEIH